MKVNLTRSPKSLVYQELLLAAGGKILVAPFTPERIYI